MRLSSSNLDIPFRSRSRWSLVYVLVFTVVVSLAGLLLLSTPSVSAQSGGGVGGAGGGSGGSGGHQSIYGYGWVVYQRSGPGPSNGFRDGTSWGSVQATCSVNDTVMAFIVMNSSQQGKVYDFLWWSSNLFTPGQKVDHGRADAIPTAVAQDAFNKIPGNLKQGYTFGSNVAWFCYDQNPPPPPSGTGMCESVSAPTTVASGASFSATFSVANRTTSTTFPANGVYKIGSQNPQDNHIWGTNRAMLSQAIAPGQVRSISASFTAPTAGGSYSFSWRFIHEGVNWYGPVCSRSISVTSTPPPPSGCATPRPTVGLPDRSPGNNPAPYLIFSPYNVTRRQNRSMVTSVNDVSSGGSRVTIPYTGGANHSVTLDYAPYGISYPYDVNQASVNYVSYYDIEHYVPIYSHPVYEQVEIIEYYTAEWPKGNFFPWYRVIGYKNGALLGYPAQHTGTTRNVTASGSVNGPVMQPCYNRGFDGMSPSVTQAYFDNNENPTRVTFTSSLTGRYTLPNGTYRGVRIPLRLNIPIQAQYYLLRAGSQTPYPLGRISGSLPGMNSMPSLMAPASFFAGPYGNVFRASIPPLQAGDRVCMVMSLAQRGTMNIDGVILSSQGSASANSSCVTSSQVLNDQAYLKTFGGEVMSGGSFGSSGSCTPAAGRGGIHAWTELRGGSYVGASAQLTVDSLLTINEFYSASQRSSGVRPNPPKGLTFANTGSSAGNSTYGGGSDHARCITDYFNDTRDPSLGSSTWNGVSLPSGVGRIQYEGLNSGQRIASAPVTVPIGTQVAVYVEGSVYIGNNITYASGAGSWENSPYFAVIATGDIYIANNVQRLDGLYVAQGRTIYTCASGPGARYNGATVYSSCGEKLTVNGGLVAQSVRFHRMRGSLRHGSVGELSTSANIAEVINYSPEMYLAPSPLRRPQSSTGGTVINPRATGLYQSIKALPPIY